MYIEKQEDLHEGKFANKNIDKIIFGPNVNCIPENCFNGCNNLKEIIFEGNINNIEAAAFMNCKKLNIIKANNINIIKDFAFHNCNVYQINLSEKQISKIKFGTYNDVLSTYFVLPEIGTPLNNIPWYKIDLISKKGKAKEYFKIGEEKELNIIENEYIDVDNNKIIKGSFKNKYHVQILGFDHDDKTDKTGKSSITFGLKEIMTTKHNINTASDSFKKGHNIGGWKDSEMRTYVNEDVYNNLPQEVKNVIKPVDKKTSEGNKSTNIITTSDKLFLLSEVEIFGSPIHTISGEGSQYQYFVDGGSKVKHRISAFDWWERSPLSYDVVDFGNVNHDGNASGYYASYIYGVVFAFCI